MWFHYAATGMKREKFVFMQMRKEDYSIEQSGRIDPKWFRPKKGKNWIILHIFDEEKQTPALEEIMFIKCRNSDYWRSRGGHYKVKWLTKKVIDRYANTMVIHRSNTNQK